MRDDYDEFPQYIPVALLRAKAEREIAKLRQKGREIQPVPPIRGNKIAKSFWGQAWCRHLESYSDYSSRLPRGRAYVRNGSVCHLEIASGAITAIVSGTELYEITIKVDTLPPQKWAALKERCSGKIGSLIELLQGKLSDQIMKVVSDKSSGLFPKPSEIHLDCNCPDWAGLCKHLAAVLYGVGNRLDTEPELLFLLRGIDREELTVSNLDATLTQTKSSKRRRIATDDLSQIFGVDLQAEPGEPAAKSSKTPTPSKDPTIHPTPKPKASKRPTKTATRTAKKTPAKAKERHHSLSPKTGTAVRKLRQKFGMSEYEFGLMIDVSAVTIRNWESKGRSTHNARPVNQQELDTIAALNVSAARKRLSEYL